MKTLIKKFALISAMVVAAFASSGCIVVASDDPVYTCASYSVGYGDYAEVYDCEEADAYNGSLVDAYWGSTVYAHNGSTIYAHNGSLVYAYAGSTVHAYPGSEVIAYAGSWVYVYSSAALTAQSSQALTAETSDGGAEAGKADTTGGADSTAKARSNESEEEPAGPAVVTAHPGANVVPVSEQQ